MGDVRVRFSKPNDYGVIDHIVVMPDGLEVYNSLRVTPNGAGAEVSFILLKLPFMNDDEFERDSAMVKSDLERLKNLLEEH